MIKIFISTTSFGKYDSKPLELLKAQDIHYESNSTGRQLTEDEIIECLNNKDGLIAGTEPLTKRVLDESEKLSVISRLGVGLDNVDEKIAKEKNIKLFNTPDGPTDAVAELTLGLLLNVLRSIGSMDRKMRQGIWEKEMGNLLSGKNVGVVGYGKIGKRFVELLVPFHCRSFFYDPYVIENGNSKVTKVETLEELLVTVDIVSLHLSYEQGNYHLLNGKRLALMKKGAVLLNASRGKLVDEEALFICLINGAFAGAGFDTFEEEPYYGPLCQLDNVVLTPHIGSYARESRVQMEIDAVMNLLKGFGIHTEVNG
jgi:D-3-phosphoglycerate dehydrogenase